MELKKTIMLILLWCVLCYGLIMAVNAVSYRSVRARAFDVEKIRIGRPLNFDADNRVLILGLLYSATSLLALKKRNLTKIVLAGAAFQLYVFVHCLTQNYFSPEDIIIPTIILIIFLCTRTKVDEEIK